MKIVTTRDLIEKLDLEIISGEKGLDREITTGELSRPALQLAGYFSHYTPQRVQILGTSELSFFKLLTDTEKSSRMGMLCTRITPCIIVSRGLDIPNELIESSNKYDTPVLRSNSETTKLMGFITYHLQNMFAPTTSVHGVFIEVYGIGILLTGESGIGKSETGLELVKRGHRLVADDRVDIFAKDEMTLWGEPAEILRHLLEIRGVGIIDVMSLYGASAVKDSSQVQLAVYLENYDTDKVFDRLGNNAEELEISGVSIPRIRIPVKTGRNISVVIEAAAMNYRSKEMGFDATRLFEERLTKLIERNEMKND